jgi:hypothetical protein
MFGRQASKLMLMAAHDLQLPAGTAKYGGARVHMHVGCARGNPWITTDVLCLHVISVLRLGVFAVLIIYVFGAAKDVELVEY